MELKPSLHQQIRPKIAESKQPILCPSCKRPRKIFLVGGPNGSHCLRCPATRGGDKPRKGAA